jgi:hypothetical protein
MSKPLPTGRQANVKSMSNDQMPRNIFGRLDFGFHLNFEL